MKYYILAWLIIFFIQTLAFFWGAKLAGVKKVTVKKSLSIAFITIIILAPIFYALSLVPLLALLGYLLLFIVPTLIVKEAYKLNIEKAFWAAFGAIAIGITAEIMLKL